MPAHASPTPSAVPPSDSTRPSISKVRGEITREAPNAERIASSRLRALARTSMRLARLTHAISRTKATAASSMTIHVRTPRVRYSSSRSTLADAVLEPAGRFGRQPGGDLIHSRLRQLEGNTVAKAADDLQPVRILVRADAVLGPEHVGNPDLCWPHGANRVCEGRRHDTENLEVCALTREVTADDVCGAAEPPLPEAMTDHRDARAAVDLVLAGERAADERTHAEHRKELRRDRLRFQRLGLAAGLGTDADAGVADRRQAREDVLLRAPVEEILRRGEVQVLVRSAPDVPLADGDQAIGARGMARSRSITPSTTE